MRVGLAGVVAGAMLAGACAQTPPPKAPLPEKKGYDETA